MCRSDGNPPPLPPNWKPGRRAFLRSAGLAGAGAAAIGVLSADPATAATQAATNATTGKTASKWRPDTESLQFTLAVMPDTQFLYWGTQGSINPEPQEESFRYIIANSGTKDNANNIVFMAHLGDLTEDADASSFACVDQAFTILDNADQPDLPRLRGRRPHREPSAAAPRVHARGVNPGCPGGT